MPKHIYLAFAASLLTCIPALAQDGDIETLQIEALPIESLQIETPQIETQQIETSFQFGGSYTNSVTLNDNGASLVLDDVKTLDWGLRAEREFARHDNLSFSGALSGQASFGEGNTPQLNGLTQAGDADYRRLGAYADVVARLEGQDESGWTPFVSGGLGVVEDRVSLDNQVFKDLSPVGRFRAGVEKKVTDKVTFGVSAGPTFKLD